MATAPISYQFTMVGQRDVIQSLTEINSLLRTGIGLSRQYARSAAGASGTGGIGGRGGTAQARASDRAAAQEARAKERAAAKLARDQERASRAAAKADVREHEWLEREKTKATQRGVKQRQKAEADAARAHKKQIADFNREYDKAIKRDAAAAKSRHRQAMQRYEASPLSDAMAGATMGLAGAVVGGTAALMGAAGRRRIDMEEKATRLAISGRGQGENAVSANELIGQNEAIAKSVKGSKAEDITAAQAKFVQITGDLESARKFSHTFATAGMATGAAPEQLAATAATLRDKFGITSEGELQSAMGTLVAQGKSGAFEFSDMAGHMAEMGAAGSRFGMQKGAHGVAQLGGLAQIARMSTGSGAEAATSVEAMFRQLILKSDDKKKESIKHLTGFDVFKDKNHTQSKDIEDVLTGVIGGAGGNVTKLTKIFGEEGVRGVSKLIEAFNEAGKSLKKGATEAEKRAAGEKAVREMLRKNIEAGGSWAEVQKDAAIAGETMQSKMTTASETIMTAFGKSVDPALQAMAKNINVVVAPLELAAKVVGTFTSAMGDVAATLHTLFPHTFKGGSGNENLTPQEAMEKYVKGRVELKKLNSLEKTYGLTKEQQYRKGEIEGEAPGLLQTIGQRSEMKKMYEKFKDDYYKPGETPMSYGEFLQNSPLMQSQLARYNLDHPEMPPTAAEKVSEDFKKNWKYTNALHGSDSVLGSVGKGLFNSIVPGMSVIGTGATAVDLSNQAMGGGADVQGQRINSDSLDSAADRLKQAADKLAQAAEKNKGGPPGSK